MVVGTDRTVRLTRDGPVYRGLCPFCDDPDQFFFFPRQAEWWCLACQPADLASRPLDRAQWRDVFCDRDEALWPAGVLLTVQVREAPPA